MKILKAERECKNIFENNLITWYEHEHEDMIDPNEGFKYETEENA
jgi:hypothetical protein